MNKLWQLISHAGDFLSSFFKTIFDMVGLFYDTIAELFRTRKRGSASALKQIISQILFTGVEAFWLVGIIGLIAA